MKSYILNGVEVKVGSMVRFIDDTNFGGLQAEINQPILGGFYTIRSFSKGKTGVVFLLDGVINKQYNLWYIENGNVVDLGIGEPGFKAARFEPVLNPPMSKENTEKESKVTGVKIKIKKEVIESLDLEQIILN